MKWFKLDCDFRYDPKVLSLIQQFGCQEACSFWVLLLAYVGENGMPGCEIQVSEFGAHSPNLLATFVGSKPKKVLTLVDASAKLGLICAERWTNDRRIYIPSMLKRLDDYTRKVRTKSEQSPENTAVEQNKKKNIEEEQISIPKKPARAAEKTKCPDQIPVTDQDRTWAKENHITVDLIAVTETMIDWAHGKGELRADWLATRHNFWRTEQQRQNGANNGHKTKTDRNAEAARRLLSRLDQQNSSGGNSGDQRGDVSGLFGAIANPQRKPDR